jgi:hypothetical protein
MTEDQLEQETLVWQAEFGDTLLPCLVTGQLCLTEVVDAN